MVRDARGSVLPSRNSVRFTRGSSSSVRSLSFPPRGGPCPVMQRRVRRSARGSCHEPSRVTRKSRRFLLVRSRLGLPSLFL